MEVLRSRESSRVGQTRYRAKSSALLSPRRNIGTPDLRLGGRRYQMPDDTETHGGKSLFERL